MSDSNPHSDRDARPTPGLTPIDRALEFLLADMVPQPGSETVALENALGRILAADYRALNSVPPWDNAAMDGFALRVADCGSPDAALPVTQRIAAGELAEPLKPGTAARIFTGAPVPHGADCVVMQENCQFDADQLHVLQAPGSGDNIRRAGDDVRQGQSLFASGHRVSPADLGMLAACGHAELRVRRPLRVALLVTGDELQPPGKALLPGQIYNSNYYTLSALIHALGMHCQYGGIVADTAEATEAALQEAAAEADCIVTSGGVSAGEEDHMRAAISSQGQLELWKLALKPGKPFAYGRVNDKPLFGLPGNPVSAFVTFVLLVRPCLLRMSGVENCLPRQYLLPAGFTRPVSGPRQEYLRVNLEGGAEGDAEGDVKGVRQVLKPFSRQSSGVLASLSYSDGLAIIPPHTAVSEGDDLRFISFSEIVN